MPTNINKIKYQYINKSVNISINLRLTWRIPRWTAAAAACTASALCRAERVTSCRGHVTPAGPPAPVSPPAEDGSRRAVRPLATSETQVRQVALATCPLPPQTCRRDSPINATIWSREFHQNTNNCWITDIGIETTRKMYSRIGMQAYAEWM